MQTVSSFTQLMVGPVSAVSLCKLYLNNVL